MKQDTHTTEVQFRLFRGEVTAVFPYIVESPHNVMCYVHLGQHSVCNWNFNAVSKPATPEQYADLYKELESIGYKLKVIKRRNVLFFLGLRSTMSSPTLLWPRSFFCSPMIRRRIFIFISIHPAVPLPRVLPFMIRCSM